MHERRRADGDLNDVLPEERRAREVLADRGLDLVAMAVVSNIFRLSTAIRRHMEGTVLAADDLSWTAFVALWCLWIWGEMESRDLAAAVGISKPTSTGVVTTLERRGLVERRKGPHDGRMVRVSLTAEGRELIEDLFPRFNQEESKIAAHVAHADRDSLAAMLRSLLRAVESAE